MNLALGCANIGQSYNGKILDLTESEGIFRCAADNGIRYFDTAHSYGVSEILIKNLLLPYAPSSYVFSKFPRERWKNAIQSSLERLSGNLLGLMWHNWELTKHNNVMLNRIIDKYKNSNFRLGCSTYGFVAAHDAINDERFQYIEIEFNILNALEFQELLALAIYKKKNLLLRSVFCRGYLTDEGAKTRSEHVFMELAALARDCGMPLEELSLRYIQLFVNNEIVILGCDSADQLEDDISYLKKPDLDASIFREVEKIVCDFKLDMRTL